MNKLHKHNVREKETEEYEQQIALGKIQNMQSVTIVSTASIL